MSDNYGTPKSSSTAKTSKSSADYCISPTPNGQPTGSAAQRRAPGQKTSRAADKTPPKGA